MQRPTDSDWFETVVDTIPSAIAGISVVGIVGIVMGVIVLRNAGVDTLGFNAIAQILGVWVIFVLLGALAMERRHIQIAYFTDRLPEPWRGYHESAVLVVSALACLVFLVSAIVATISSFGQTVPAPSVLPMESFPMATYFASAVIGMVLITAVYLRDVWEHFELSERLGQVRTSD